MASRRRRPVGRRSTMPATTWGAFARASRRTRGGTGCERRPRHPRRGRRRSRHGDAASCRDRLRRALRQSWARSRGSSARRACGCSTPRPRATRCRARSRSCADASCAVIDEANEIAVGASRSLRRLRDRRAARGTGGGRRGRRFGRGGTHRRPARRARPGVPRRRRAGGIERPRATGSPGRASWPHRRRVCSGGSLPASTRWRSRSRGPHSKRSVRPAREPCRRAHASAVRRRTWSCRPCRSHGPATAPTSLADAAARIPAGGEARIRVERYTMSDGSRQFAVYVAGTQTVAPQTREPFDMDSNVELYTGERSASYEATLAALEQAGAEPGDVVHAFGHSQGAMVVAHLALEGGFDDATLVSFGSPVEARCRRRDAQRRAAAHRRSGRRARRRRPRRCGRSARQLHRRAHRRSRARSARLCGCRPTAIEGYTQTAQTAGCLDRCPHGRGASGSSTNWAARHPSRSPSTRPSA